MGFPLRINSILRSFLNWEVEIFVFFLLLLKLPWNNGDSRWHFKMSANRINLSTSPVFLFFLLPVWETSGSDYSDSGLLILLSCFRNLCRSPGSHSSQHSSISVWPNAGCGSFQLQRSCVLSDTPCRVIQMHCRVGGWKDLAQDRKPSPLDLCFAWLAFTAQLRGAATLLGLVTRISLVLGSVLRFCKTVLPTTNRELLEAGNCDQLWLIQLWAVRAGSTARE